MKSKNLVARLKTYTLFEWTMLLLSTFTALLVGFMIITSIYFPEVYDKIGEWLRYVVNIFKME